MTLCVCVCVCVCVVMCIPTNAHYYIQDYVYFRRNDVIATSKMCRDASCVLCHIATILVCMLFCTMAAISTRLFNTNCFYTCNNFF